MNPDVMLYSRPAVDYESLTLSTSAMLGTNTAEVIDRAKMRLTSLQKYLGIVSNWSLHATDFAHFGLLAVASPETITQSHHQSKLSHAVFDVVPSVATASIIYGSLSDFQIACRGFCSPSSDHHLRLLYNKCWMILEREGADFGIKYPHEDGTFIWDGHRKIPARNRR